MYKLRIVKIDENGEETVVADDRYKSIAMLADTGGKGFTELIMNDNLIDLSTKIASAKVFRKAAKLATTLLSIRDDEREDAETDLIKSILEGLK